MTLASRADSSAAVSGCNVSVDESSSSVMRPVPSLQAKDCPQDSTDKNRETAAANSVVENYEGGGSETAADGLHCFIAEGCVEMVGSDHGVGDAGHGAD